LKLLFFIVFIFTNILFSNDFCKDNIIGGFDNKNIKYGKVLRNIDIKYKYRRDLNNLSRKIIYEEPFNPAYVNKYIYLLRKNEKITKHLLRVLEIATLFNVDRKSLLNIKQFYIDNFNEIRKIYLKKQTNLRYFVLKKINILDNKDLSLFKSNIKIDIEYPFFIFTNIKKKKIKKVKINYKSICLSSVNIDIKRKHMTALDLSIPFMNTISDPESEYYFLNICKNKKLFYFYKYLYTGKIEFLNKIVDKKHLIQEAKEAIGENKLYKAWVLSSQYINNINNTLSNENIKYINEAKDINLVAGEDISSNFFNNKDYKNYNIIKNKTIKNTLKLIRLKD